jgi:LPXTG-site transpeptidase (sortase) family protein
MARHAVPVTAIGSALAGGAVFMIVYLVALEWGWQPVSSFTLPPPVALSDDGGAMTSLGSDSGAAGLFAGIRDGDSMDEHVPALPPSLARAPRSQGPAIEAGPMPMADVASTVWIPSIALNTSVVFGGAQLNKSTGELEWQTQPFVAVHYAADTALVGSQNNAVIAGHVATLSMGNVFRNLYKVLPGDRVFVKTQSGGMVVYEITTVKLTSPTAVDVMKPTSDGELTLITCGGTFDAKTRTFDKRLVVVAKLVGTATV